MNGKESLYSQIGDKVRSLSQDSSGRLILDMAITGIRSDSLINHLRTDVFGESWNPVIFLDASDDELYRRFSNRGREPDISREAFEKIIKNI